jgi:N-formylmaleamate deformylase
MTGRHVLQSAVADLAGISATSRWARSGDLRLHVLDYGGGSIPLVIVPGISSPAITMDFVASKMPESVRPLIIDMRGRGLSDAAGPYDLGTYVDDLFAVIEGLELSRPIVVGHSMGARVAALAAARRRLDLRGTVVVDPPMSGPGRGLYPVPAATLLVQLAEAQAGVTADQVAAQWPAWPAREAAIRARWLSSCEVHAVADTHRGFETEDFFEFWADVPAPVVLMYGGDSPMVTQHGATEAAAANPGAHLVKVPDAGHMVFSDNPSAAIPLLYEVVAGLASPSI